MREEQVRVGFFRGGAVMTYIIFFYNMGGVIFSNGEVFWSAVPFLMFGVAYIFFAVVFVVCAWVFVLDI